MKLIATHTIDGRNTYLYKTSRIYGKKYFITVDMTHKTWLFDDKVVAFLAQEGIVIHEHARAN
jgi:hypothetical protein